MVYLYTIGIYTHFKRYKSKGTHVIGALKTNRILYPQGIRIQVKQFATHIQKEDTDFVTVGGKRTACIVMKGP